MDDECAEKRSSSLGGSIKKAEELMKRSKTILNFGAILSLYAIISFFLCIVLWRISNDVVLFVLVMSASFIVLAFIGVFAYFQFVGLQDSINGWRKSYLAFSIHAKYGLTPAQGYDRGVRARNLAFAAHDGLEDEYTESADDFTPDYKTGTGYVFDLVVTKPAFGIYVKYLDAKALVDLDSLMGMENEALSHKVASKRKELIVVSTQPYSADAISFAKKHDGVGSKLVFDLLVERDGRYVVTHIGRRPCD